MYVVCIILHYIVYFTAYYIIYNIYYTIVYPICSSICILFFSTHTDFSICYTVPHYMHILNTHTIFYTYIYIVSKDIDRLKRRNTASEKEMLHSYAMKYFKDIVSMLGRLPSDLLLVLKTNDCLRHLDLQLGAPVNTTLVLAETIAQEILYEDLTAILYDNNTNTNNNIFMRIMYTIPIWLSWMNSMIRIFGLKCISYYFEWKGISDPFQWIYILLQL